MITDRKRYKIARKELFKAVKKTKSLDELISLLKSKYSELTGKPYNEQEDIVSIPSSTRSEPVKTVPMTEEEQMQFVAPEEFDRETLDDKIERIVCPHCGKEIEYSQGTVFCPNCGMPID
ncbi:MAG: zinc-ribbon domain-containing protein [Candidatus Lokiarchaeota archaeon]|nr:zinc-ribbon domain-containing protein [Candidatus Lokiarchaeota archaeon]